MRLMRLALVVAATALVVGSVSAAPSYASVVAPSVVATARTQPTISEVTWTGPHSVVLTGTQVAKVFVRMRIVSPDADVFDDACWDGDCSAYWHYPYIKVSRGLSMWANENRLLKLVSGDRRDGVWQAQIPVSANDAPSVRLDYVTVAAGPNWQSLVYAGGPMTDFVTNPGIVVTGIDPPVIEVRTSPATASDAYHGMVTASLRLVLKASRTPLPGRPLVWCFDMNECNQHGIGGTQHVTDAAGRATFRIPRDGYQFADQVWFYRANSGPAIDDVVYTGVFMGLPYKFWVTAATPGAIPLGSSAILSGRAGGRFTDFSRQVVVQRWVSRAWRVQGQAVVRSSGRWSYALTPKAAGNYVYRVYKPGFECLGGRCRTSPGFSAPVTVSVR